MKQRPQSSQPVLPWAVTLVTLLVAVSLGELALRLFRPQLSLKYGDEEFSPRYHHIGAQLRDELREIQRRHNNASQAFTVAILGDSFVEASDVKPSERFTDLLQAGLDRELPGRVKIVNLGHTSYSTIIYDRLFRDIVPTLRPDLVLICLDQTDPVDDLIYSRDLARTADDGLDPPFTHTILAQLSTLGGRFWLYAHSRLFLLTEELSTRYIGQSFVSSSLARQMAARNAEKTRLYIDTSRSPESTGELFGLQKAYMEAIDRAAAGRVPVLFVTYPRAEHIAGQPKTTLINGAIADRAFSAVYTEHWVKKDGLESRLRASRFLHTSEAFRKASNDGRILYFHQNDVHWTSDGHRLFADLLHPVIRRYVEHAAAGAL